MAIPLANTLVVIELPTELWVDGQKSISITDSPSYKAITLQDWQRTAAVLSTPHEFEPVQRITVYMIENLGPVPEPETIFRVSEKDGSNEKRYKLFRTFITPPPVALKTWGFHLQEAQ